MRRTSEIQQFATRFRDFEFRIRKRGFEFRISKFEESNFTFRAFEFQTQKHRGGTVAPRGDRGRGALGGDRFELARIRLRRMLARVALKPRMENRRVAFLRGGRGGSSP